MSYTADRLLDRDRRLDAIEEEWRSIVNVCAWGVLFVPFGIGMALLFYQNTRLDRLKYQLREMGVDPRRFERSRGLVGHRIRVGLAALSVVVVMVAGAIMFSELLFPPSRIIDESDLDGPRRVARP